MAIRPIVASVGLLCGSLLIAFVALEVSLRLVYPPPTRFLYPQESYDFDPETGHVLRPRQKAYTHDRVVRINSLGLRDGEITAEPSPGRWRVLGLGDSQTFGNGLELSETWPKQLERMLNGLGGNRWEVVNAGIPGTDTWQHEIILRRLLLATNPHAVVLAVYVNDIALRFEPHSVDQSAATNTWSKRFVYILKRSAVVTWINSRLVLSWRAGGFRRRNSTEDIVLAGGNDDRVERGWEQFERSIVGMKELCDARRVVFLLAILPRRDQVSGVNRARAYNVRARGIAERHRIEVLDLLPDLSAAYGADGNSLFIPWDGHNSAVANHVIAARIAGRLVELAPHGWPRRSSRAVTTR